jgi:hypothetical protein
MRQIVPDPTGGPGVCEYDERRRRVCEVIAILGGATGPVVNGNGGL